MEPASRDSRFPVLGDPASFLAELADIENAETLRDNLGKYESNNYSYVPLPESDQYYNRESDSIEELRPDQFIEADADLRAVFQKLVSEEFLLIDKGESFEIGERYQIITLADLNRRFVGEQLYPIIAELEEQLALAIREDVDDPEELYHNVSPEIIGRREKDILSDIEVHTAEYLGIGEMIGLLKGRGHLWDKFGFESASDCEDRLNSIKMLRNRVMHSNRSLIRDRVDVERTLERVNDAQKIIAKAQNIPPEKLPEGACGY